jgi:hypothetical protein
MGPFSTTIHYSNLSDLKERLHDMLDDLARLEVVPASEMQIADLIEYTRDRAFREMGMGVEIVDASSSAMSVAETDEEVQDAAPELDPEAFKEAAIERLKEIYLLKGGAKLIDVLIKKHGGGETAFKKISADRYPAIMEEVDREFPRG